MASPDKIFVGQRIVIPILPGSAGEKTTVLVEDKFSSDKTGIVKVMTFNIRVASAWVDGPNRWNKRKWIVFSTLRDNAADVIGLQEALNSQVRQIQHALPEYANYRVSSVNGKQRGPACAIFYRKDRFELDDCGTFWFSNTPDKPGSKYRGNVWPRICSWIHLVDKSNQIGFYVYNLHLDCWSQQSRDKSVRLLANRIAARKHRDAFMVTGDFNMELNNPAMEYLQEIDYRSACSKMVDSWMSVHPDENSLGTYHKFKGKMSCRRIDHIPISEDFEVLDVNIDRRSYNGRYPSDHFPVTATVRLVPKEPVLLKKVTQNPPSL
jgi:endonuclease/exonuclease/phosphatase family metal-dependent hydrolase